MSRNSSSLNWLHSAKNEMAAHQDHFCVQCCQNLHQGAKPESLTGLLYPQLQHYVLFQLMVWSFPPSFCQLHSLLFYFKFLWKNRHNLKLWVSYLKPAGLVHSFFKKHYLKIVLLASFSSLLVSPESDLLFCIKYVETLLFSTWSYSLSQPIIGLKLSYKYLQILSLIFKIEMF